ncbi:MAG TPA: amidohydrolase [Desulfobacteraceae bacterium]|nr:amidohydrolase [Deltaproteobacteria bacterium]MBW2356145.1 amidohydrolase [Deltaproteobacteria bacterium]RLB97945.1 MAG: 4-hydroxyphenyl-beta-ketoacyl-CoA hydrolase [Deltaproteobacteria bacterium]HDI60836.1 amidohydrolase [Desulfobacteraceae bacterium]
MIIDTHSQLFTAEAIESFPEEMARSYQAMFRNMALPTIEDTIADMDAAGVDRTVIVGIDAETTHRYKVSNDLVAQTVARFPDRLIGFAGADPHKGRLACDELARAVNELGLRGLKLLPHLADIAPDDRRMYPLYETARGLKIPVLFHSGTQFHAGTKIRFCRPLYLDTVAVDFPDLQIVMAHFGYPWFHEGLAVVLRNPNVWFNIAGWAPKRIPEEVIRQINGPLRYKALFGSDYPLLKRTRIVAELDQLPFKEGVRQLLTSDNPKRLLGL